MHVRALQDALVVLRILALHLVYPPLRVRIAADFGARRRNERRLALSQKGAQHGIHQTARARVAERIRAAHGKVDDGVRRRPGVNQLKERDAQQVAQAPALERPIEQRIERGIDLTQEAQRAERDVLKRRAIAGGERGFTRPSRPQFDIEAVSIQHATEDASGMALDLQHQRVVRVRADRTSMRNACSARACLTRRDAPPARATNRRGRRRR